MKDVEQIFVQSQMKLQEVKVNSVKKIYFMGIKGVGMTALALMAKQAGFTVRGCDVEKEFITDEALHNEGIKVDSGFDVNAISSFVGDGDVSEVLVIITGAHDGFANPIAIWAKEKGISVITQGQAVGLYMQGGLLHKPETVGISVAGSHGKTTVTAMIATMLSEAERDPSYVIGTGSVKSLGDPGHFGIGKEFVAEADEYASDIHHDLTPKLFYQNPTYAIVNNIDFDHPDFYDSIDDVHTVFAVFMQKVVDSGKLIVNGDDQRIQDIVSSFPKDHVMTYGKGIKNDIVLSNFTQKDTISEFEVIFQQQSLGIFQLQVPGSHNALNSLAAVGVGLQLGLSDNVIKQGLEAFKGTKRRSEIVGQTKNGAVIIDDYAHHPKEIETTLASLKTAYPQKKIVCIFQPHTYSRTESLLSEFASSLLLADEIVLLPVFASARESQSEDTVSERLVRTIQSGGKQVHFIKSASDVIKYVINNYSSPDILILTMGAGDVYKISEELKVDS